jgi:hypothetical protein
MVPEGEVGGEVVVEPVEEPVDDGGVELVIVGAVVQLALDGAELPAELKARTL